MTATAVPRPPTVVAPDTDSHREPPVRRCIRHVLVLAKRSLIKTWRTPEALIDVTLQPIIFLLLFTYIFGGAIAGGSRHDYLQFLLPGLLGQSIAMAGVALGQNLNADIEKGVFDRFRSLPIARSVPLVGAVLADVVRYLILCVVDPRLRVPHGLPDRDQRRSRRSAAVALSDRVRAVLLLDLGVGRHDGADPGAVQGIMFLLVLPLSFGSNTFVPTGDDAGLAAGLRQGQPDHPSGRRGARPDDRRTGGLARAVDTGLDGRVAHRVRPLATRAYRRRT